MSKQIHNQPQMHPMIRYCIPHFRHMIQLLPPIDFEYRAIFRQNVPAQPRADARQRFHEAWHRIDRGGPVLAEVPAMRHIDKGRKLNHRLAAGPLPQRKARLDRRQEDVVAERRHFAMALLHSGVDSAVMALWLGHETMDTIQMYLHASLELKQQALDKTTPVNGRPGRYQPDDALLAFLTSL